MLKIFWNCWFFFSYPSQYAYQNWAMTEWMPLKSFIFQSIYDKTIRIKRNIKKFIAWLFAILFIAINFRRCYAIQTRCIEMTEIHGFIFPFWKGKFETLFTDGEADGMWQWTSNLLTSDMKQWICWICFYVCYQLLTIWKFYNFHDVFF